MDVWSWQRCLHTRVVSEEDLVREFGNLSCIFRKIRRKQVKFVKSLLLDRRAAVLLSPSDLRMAMF